MTGSPTENNFFNHQKLVAFFLKVSESVDSLNWYGSFLSIQKASQKNIINLLLVSQVLLKSKARSTALASAVKLMNRQVYDAHYYGCLI